MHNKRFILLCGVLQPEMVFINKDMLRMSIDLAKNFELPKKSNFATAGTLVLVAALLAGCSSVPNWANPVSGTKALPMRFLVTIRIVISGDARLPTYIGREQGFFQTGVGAGAFKAPTIGRKRLAEQLHRIGKTQNIRGKP